MRRRLPLRATVAGALSLGLMLGAASIAVPSASAAGSTPSPTVGVASTSAPTPPPTTKPPVTKPPVTKPPVVTCKAPVIPPKTKPSPAFYRATTRPGMRDAGVFAINHVREAQYRLRWAKVYKGRVNGYYNAATKAAVKRFQVKNCLKATGTLDRASWVVLIKKSIRHSNAIPKVCKGSGWHSCYDRASHQDFLFKDGRMWNVWLVRGGMQSTQTRTGTFTVHARYVSKVSTLFHVRMYYFMPHSGGQGQHGSGFMIDPWVGHSHGCINMYIKDAHGLFYLTQGSRLTVTVYGRWS